MSVWGCGEAPPPSPTAVVHAEPASVCHGDDFDTTIRLDASASTPGLTLVPVPASEDGPALTFAWAFSGAAYEIQGEDPSGVEMLITTSGERPLHVELTVTNAVGGEAVTVHSLPVTFLELQPCSAGACPSSLRCLAHHGRDACVPDVSCTVHADCPVCMRCDEPSEQCVPVEAVP